MADNADRDFRNVNTVSLRLQPISKLQQHEQQPVSENNKSRMDDGIKQRVWRLDYSQQMLPLKGPPLPMCSCNLPNPKFCTLLPVLNMASTETQTSEIKYWTPFTINRVVTHLRSRKNAADNSSLNDDDFSSNQFGKIKSHRKIRYPDDTLKEICGHENHSERNGTPTICFCGKPKSPSECSQKVEILKHSGDVNDAYYNVLLTGHLTRDLAVTKNNQQRPKSARSHSCCQKTNKPACSTNNPTDKPTKILESNKKRDHGKFRYPVIPNKKKKQGLIIRYQNPLNNCSHNYRYRIAQLEALQQNTIRWERLEKFKRLEPVPPTCTSNC